MWDYLTLPITVNIRNPNVFRFRRSDNNSVVKLFGFRIKICVWMKWDKKRPKTEQKWFLTIFVFKTRYQTGFVRFSDVFCPICPQIGRIFKYKTGLELVSFRFQTFGTNLSIRFGPKHSNRTFEILTISAQSQGTKWPKSEPFKIWTIKRSYFGVGQILVVQISAFYCTI